MEKATVKGVRDFIRGMYQKKNFARRLIAVILAVIVMGFALSWLVLVDLGTDPCTSLNLAISEKLGMSLGNWQALFNSILFLFVILLGREFIGFGTLANMFLVGYAVDFFSAIWALVLPDGVPDSLAVRLAIMVPALTVFVVAAAVYMDVELGTAPYDAIPLIVDKHQKRIPFRWLRMAYDFSMIGIGLLFGADIGIMTILMALTLGPVITLLGKKMNRFLGVEYE